MNLLTDPLLRVETARGGTNVSLPRLLAALGQDEIEHLVGIQRHQEDAFHVFLCNLAAVVLARHGKSDPVQTENFWRDGLRQLAGDAGDDAWTLVVGDLSRPAFMQPPLPTSDREKLKPIEPFPNSPDALDLLPTAKNHDVKRARANNAEPDDWIYALVSLQTMSGYFGRGNPGITRMNSGFGNRLIVELTRTVRLGERWVDAVARLTDYRNDVLEQPFGYDERGLELVWLAPWDGESSLPLSALDPFYIEICRRIRLSMIAGHIVAAAAPAKAVRIAATELKGVVGDAWLPVDVNLSANRKASEDKALTISPDGLTADVLRRLVFEDGLKTTQLQRPQSSWKGNMWLRASVLVRGQGTTDGFHERSILIPPRVQPRLFAAPERREPLAVLAQTAIQYTGTMRRSVLRPAILAYLQGGPEKIQSDRESTDWWICFARRFESLWSQDYFPWLWSVPEPFDQERILIDWTLLLRDHALTVLHEAHSSMPTREGRLWRSRSRSEGRFWSALYHQFPLLKEVNHEYHTS